VAAVAVSNQPLKLYPPLVGALGAVTDSFVKYEALETAEPPCELKLAVNRSLGVITVLAVDESDVPKLVTATTVNVSGLPVVKPEIVIGDVAEVPVLPCG
jgi:hypothetical protein